METHSRLQEIDANYETFEEILPDLLEQHRGRYCLLRDRKIVEIFDTARDAYICGTKMFADERFSIQEVTDVPVDLGIFSHAVPFSDL